MKKLKDMNKTTKSNMLTYTMVIVIYLVVQGLVTTGNISSLLKGLLVPICVYVIAAVSLNLVVGISGELSLGHAGFMCVGAYSSAFFSNAVGDAMPDMLRFVLAILIGVPMGVMTAIFLAEVAPKRLSDMVRPAVELLAGIPSVIYGLLGILILNPLMYKMELILFKGSETHQFTGGANLISAVLVLALMILPTVINISESALRSVPAHLKSASLALGATKIQTIFQVIVPAAKSGIITAVVLGTGRAIGEAMAISLVSGSSVNLPLPFSSVRFLTTAIVSEMGYASGLHRQVLFTIGLVLFAFIMIINISLTRILKRGGNRNDK